MRPPLSEIDPMRLGVLMPTRGLASSAPCRVKAGAPATDGAGTAPGCWGWSAFWGALWGEAVCDPLTPCSLALAACSWRMRAWRSCSWGAA